VGAFTVDLERVRERQDMYLANHYIGFHNMAVSVGLAVAGIAVASMLDLPETYQPYAPLLWLMLLTSFLGVAVAYSGTITGAPLLPPTVPAAPDLFLPLFVALSEFFLLGVLAHQVVGLANPDAVVTAWFCAFTVYALSTSLSVARARSLIARGVYAPDAEPLVNELVKRLWRDVLSTAVLVTVSLAGAVYRLIAMGYFGWPDYVFVVLLMVIVAAGFWSHASWSKEFLTHLRGDA
jgi:hypothetical protein